MHLCYSFFIILLTFSQIGRIPRLSLSQMHISRGSRWSYEDLYHSEIPNGLNFNYSIDSATNDISATPYTVSEHAKDAFHNVLFNVDEDTVTTLRM